MIFRTMKYTGGRFEVSVQGHVYACSTNSDDLSTTSLALQGVFGPQNA